MERGNSNLTSDVAFARLLFSGYGKTETTSASLPGPLCGSVAASAIMPPVRRAALAIKGPIMRASGRLRQDVFGISFSIAFTFRRALKMLALKKDPGLLWFRLEPFGGPRALQQRGCGRWSPRTMDGLPRSGNPVAWYRWRCRRRRISRHPLGCPACAAHPSFESL